MASRAPNGPYLIEVNFEARPDGGMRAYCDAVPGFVLSGANPQAVLADVEPALATIISAMYQAPVTVELMHQLGFERSSPMPAHLCGPLQYVAQSKHA